MSETSEAPPPPEVVEQPVEIPPPQAETAPVSESPQELPPLPDAPPEFDDTPAEAPQDGGQEQVSDAPQDPAQEVSDEPQEPMSEAPPEFDDTPAEAPEDGEQEQISEAPQETPDTPAHEVSDEPQEPTNEAPPEFDDTPAEAPEDGEQEQVSDSPQETPDTPDQEVSDEPQEPTEEAPPEFVDTPAEAPQDDGQEQISDAPQETPDTPAQEVSDEPQEPMSEAPPEFDDTPAEAPEDGAQEPVGESNEAENDQAKAEDDQAQVEADQAKAEDDQAKVEADQAKAEEDLTKVEDDQAKAEEDLTKVEDDQAKVEDDLTKAEDDQAKAEDDQAKAEDDQAKAEDDQAKAEDDLAKVEDDQAKAEDDQTKAEDDQAKEAEGESEAEDPAAIEAVEHLPEDQSEEPAKREDNDTDDENAGDRVREHDKQPPAAGSEGDFSRAETDSEPPSYEKELMDLEVAESRELCQRIGDSYKDYDKSDLERRDDGSLFFKDYQVELTAQGDAFGSYKDLQRWIADHGMAGSRQDGSPYLEAHHVIPAAECKEAGLDPNLAPCVAVQNDLHIAMLHGSAGLTNRPEFSSVERMRAYYEGFYDGLNAATWARRAGDYLHSHNDAFKATLAERHAALAPVAPPTAEVADRKPEHKAPLTGVATPFGIDRPFASSIKTAREVTEKSGIGDAKAETDHAASARLDEGWKKIWSEHPSEEIRSRFETAYNFYKDNGVHEDRIISHLKGIDFHNEVKVLQGKAGDIVYSHLKDGKIGNYFSKGDPKETLGIQPAPENIGPERPDRGRFERATEAFIATGPFAYLESTASWLHEWDDERAGKIGVEIFEGGGRQLYIPDKSVFQPILPMQSAKTRSK
jgi:hypothetical protein